MKFPEILSGPFSLSSNKGGSVPLFFIFISLNVLSLYMFNGSALIYANKICVSSYFLCQMSEGKCQMFHVKKEATLDFRPFFLLFLPFSPFSTSLFFCPVVPSPYLSVSPSLRLSVSLSPRRPIAPSLYRLVISPLKTHHS